MAGPHDRSGRLFPNLPSRIGGLGEIVRVFWRAGDRSALMISRQPAPPTGFRLIDAYALVPDAASPRYLLPLSSRRLTARSLQLYSSLRSPLRRVLRVAAGMGLRVGLVQPWLRDRIYIHARRDASMDDLAEISLTHHLAKLFDEDRITALISLGGAGPYAKPVMQVLSTSGTPIGFVKVGWDDVTARLVANEARMLRLCEGSRLRTVQVPRLISASTWNDLELTVAAPLPEDVRRYSARVPPSVGTTEEIASLTDCRPEPLWGSTYADDLRRRVRAQGPTPRTPDILEQLRHGSHEATMRIGAWHGDWSPWNLATRGAELFAWDWEHSGDRVPLGFDVIHFHFQTGFILDRLELGTAVRRAAERSRPALRALGVPDGLTRTLILLYLLEISLRADELVRLGGVPNIRLYPRIHEILRRPQDLSW
jgi:hypothetical protein